MSAHPSRAGSISAQLFAQFVGELTLYECQTTTADELRQHILNAAMRIAMQRASRKFRWPPDGEWDADFDSFGQPYNIRIGSNLEPVTAAESAWIFTEVAKIAKHALAALEQS